MAPVDFPKSHNLDGEHKGKGTSLKPAHEPIVVARKPLVGTVAQTVSEFGTGAINVDACRIGTEKMGGYDQVPSTSMVQPSQQRASGYRPRWDREDVGFHAKEASGRWPANVVLDEAAAAELDRQSGERPGASSNSRDGTGIFDPGSHELQPGYGDTGGASRFFATFQSPGFMDYGSDVGGGSSSQGLDDTPENVRAVESSSSEQSAQATADVSARFRYVAKASRAERNAGLEGFEERDRGSYDPVMRNMAVDGHGQVQEREQTARNVHPTVKPVELMRWLCRLVTPPGGTVLDPFAGSGTTGIACVLEDFDFIGIEREAEYVEIAKARIDYWAKQPKQLDLLDAA